MKDGEATLDLSKDEKLALPATVESLRTAILELMPHARLADVFPEVEGSVTTFPILMSVSRPRNATHAPIWPCLPRSWRMDSICP